MAEIIGPIKQQGSKTLSLPKTIVERKNTRVTATKKTVFITPTMGLNPHFSPAFVHSICDRRAKLRQSDAGFFSSFSPQIEEHGRNQERQNHRNRHAADF
jgi:hypothetical protein